MNTLTFDIETIPQQEPLTDIQQQEIISAEGNLVNKNKAENIERFPN